MKQVRSFNPDVPCIPGECLKYVQDGFGIPARYTGAIIDWNNNTNNHSDYNFPSGCVVPIYFSGTGNNLISQWGHVAAVMPDGSVYSCSSPTSNHAIHYASISALIADYARVGITLHYLGWSEDVEEIKVVEEVDMIESIDDVNALYLATLHRYPTPDEAKPWVGMQWRQAIDNMRASKEYSEQNNTLLVAFPAVQQQVNTLESQLKAMPQDTTEAQKTVDNLKAALEAVLRNANA